MMSNEIRLLVRAKQQATGAEYEEVKDDSNEVSDASQSLTFSERKKQLLSEMESAESQFFNSQPREAPMPTRLTMVPEILLHNKNFRDHYKPKEMSIGPVYAKSNALFKRELKVKLAAKFIRSNCENKEVFLDVINRNIENLRKCFGEEMPSLLMSNDELVELLFLDGCSILQFAISYRMEKLREFNISKGQATLIKQDLFLLENQIPFQVLRLLIGEASSYSMMTKDPERILYFLFRFVVSNNILVSKNFYAVDIPIEAFLRKHEPVHLLDLMRKLLIFGNDFHAKELHEKKKMEWINYIYNDSLPLMSSQERSFRNVRELNLSGIKLKPDEYNNLLDISFTTHFFIIGHLKLPKLIVDDTTIGKLLNLVAYEMSLDDYDNNCEVTSYVNFLDLLVDSEEDVKELRAARIICNRLSSDAEVAQLFSDLGSNCLAPPRDAYLIVKDKIQKHYERKSAIWMAQVYHEHFKSPWTVLALFAAVTILFLTGTQTWFTINPK